MPTRPPWSIEQFERKSRTLQLPARAPLDSLLQPFGTWILLGQAPHAVAVIFLIFELIAVYYKNRA